MSTSAFFQGAHDPVVNGGTLHSANAISIHNHYYGYQPGQHPLPQPAPEVIERTTQKEESRLDNLSDGDKILSSLEEKHMRTEDLLVTLIKLVQEVQSTRQSDEPILQAADASKKALRPKQVMEIEIFSNDYDKREKQSFRFRQGFFKKFKKAGPSGGNTSNCSERRSGSESHRKLNELSDLSSKPIRINELSSKDAIIAVMGQTGAGKSSFISMACGSTFDSARVGHFLESCTSEISLFRLKSVELPYNIVLVDTPGFDDTHKSDVEILGIISNWLATTYGNRLYLTGLLYLHRITDNRMAGTPLKNIRVFEELCGQKMFQNIILVTTMWDRVIEGVGRERERWMKELYWKRMITKGSTTQRYRNTQASALEIIQPLVNSIGRSQAVLLQEEMVDMRMRLRDTSAGCALYSKLEGLVALQQDLMERIRVESRTSTRDEAALKALGEEYVELRENLKETMTEMQTIKPSLGKRLYRYLTFEPKGKKYVGEFS